MNIVVEPVDVDGVGIQRTRRVVKEAQRNYLYSPDGTRSSYSMSGPSAPAAGGYVPSKEGRRIYCMRWSSSTAQFGMKISVRLIFVCLRDTAYWPINEGE